MMVEDHSDERSLRKRSVLADLSNQNGKRGLPQFLAGDGFKLVDDVLRNAKRLCSSRNVVCVDESPQNFIMPSSVSLMDEKLHFEMDGTVEKGGVLKKNCISGVSVGLGHEHCSTGNISSSVVVGEISQYDTEMLNLSVPQNVVGIDPSSEPFATHVIGRDSYMIDGDNLTSNKSDVVGCVGVSGSSKVSKLERCRGFNDCDGEKCKDAEETVDPDVSRNLVGTNSSSETLNTNVIRDIANSGKCKEDGETMIPDVCRNAVGTNSSSEPLDSHVIENTDKDEKCKDDEGMVDPDAAGNIAGSNASSETLSDHVIGNDDEGMDGDELTSNKSGSVGCVGLSVSSSSRGFESERCTAFSGGRGGGGSDPGAGTDLLKSCSCSFCLKAAHIWSDLHYQDAKGRLSVLKKSRKEVRTLVERSSMLGSFAKKFQGDPNKSVKLESDLVGGWRSLFLQTEDILLKESAQLQSSLTTLKELRGNCKTDLEMITGDPLNKK